MSLILKFTRLIFKCTLTFLYGKYELNTNFIFISSIFCEPNKKNIWKCDESCYYHTKVIAKTCGSMFEYEILCGNMKLLCFVAEREWRSHHGELLSRLRQMCTQCYPFRCRRLDILLFLYQIINNNSQKMGTLNLYTSQR